MTIDSKCPRKWAFVDLETGDVWVHKSRHPKLRKSHYTFYRADKEAIRALVAVAVLNVADELKELK
jgi:hypothetical protein